MAVAVIGGAEQVTDIGLCGLNSAGCSNGSSVLATVMAGQLVPVSGDVCLKGARKRGEGEQQLAPVLGIMEGRGNRTG
jgi:hypothetical protein